MSGSGKYSPLSTNEAAKRLTALTKTEKAKLVIVAESMAQNTGWGGEDLLQEAMTRVLSGKRHLPAEVSTVKALSNVMRSLVSDIRSSSEGTIAKGSAEFDAGDDPDAAPAGDPVDSAAIPVDDGVVEALNAKFAGDEQTQLVLGALVQGDSPDEICAALEIDKTRYATIRRRLRRAYNDLGG